MKRRVIEWLSVQLVKNPGRIVLSAILLFNVVFFFFSAVIISNMSLSGTEQMSFLEAAFCTVTMILDAACIRFVIADIGHASVAVVILNWNTRASEIVNDLLYNGDQAETVVELEEKDKLVVFSNH